jgi:hypothetical protein
MPPFVRSLRRCASHGTYGRNGWIVGPRGGVVRIQLHHVVPCGSHQDRSRANKEGPSMRIFLYLAAALAVTGCVLYASPARADDLTGNMAAFSYLVAKPWNCTTSVPAMAGQPARTDQSTATFEVAPGNAVHNHVRSAVFSGDFYFGYSDRMSTYWQAGSDNMGGHSFLTSTDGKTYTGTSSMGTASMQDTTTYTKLAPNKVTVHEVLSGGPMAGTFDSVCNGVDVSGM